MTNEMGIVWRHLICAVTEQGSRVLGYSVKSLAGRLGSELAVACNTSPELIIGVLQLPLASHAHM